MDYDDKLLSDREIKVFLSKLYNKRREDLKEVFNEIIVKYPDEFSFKIYYPEREFKYYILSVSRKYRFDFDDTDRYGFIGIVEQQNPDKRIKKMSVTQAIDFLKIFVKLVRTRNIRNAIINIEKFM